MFKLFDFHVISTVNGTNEIIFLWNESPIFCVINLKVLFLVNYLTEKIIIKHNISLTK